MRTAVCGRWWALAKALVIVDRGVVMPGLPLVICVEDCADCPTFFMQVTGFRIGAGVFVDLYINNATITMLPSDLCEWTKVFAVGDCGSIDTRTGEQFPQDCDIIVSSSTKIKCLTPGQPQGHPDGDSYQAFVDTSGFGGGWCYRSFQGPCPSGAFPSYVLIPGCAGGPLPDHTPGTLTVS